jgi:MFS family permease
MASHRLRRTPPAPLAVPQIAPGRSARAVGALFFVNGMTFSNWLPRIPEVRDRLGLDNAGLGATLLGGGLGGFIGSFLVARVLVRWGTKRTVIVAATLLAVGLPFIALARTAAALTMVLTVLGFLDVLNDMAMNAQGVMVQRRLGRSIMNRLHGGWSLGFTVGAGLGSLAAAADVSLTVHLGVVMTVLVATVLSVRRFLIPTDADTSSGPAPRHKALSTTIAAIAVMAVAISCIEGIPNEWSAVLLRDHFGTGRWSGTATVVFAGSMLVGRMGGDHVLDRIGRSHLLSVALSISAVGAAVVVTAPASSIALVGFGIWGLGVSVVFPQLYTIAATLPSVSPGAGLGAMGVGQRLGFLISPVCVGALAEWRSLRTAIAVMAVISLISVVATRRVAASPGSG